MARMQALVILTLAALTAPAIAADSRAVLGGAIGGGAGAAVGSQIGGRDGAIIGGALGGAAGAAIGSSGSRQKETTVITREVVVEKEVVYDEPAPRIPAGHYPPPGECRIWYADRPAGHQPPPTRCDRIRSVPRGASLIRG